jgi:hypothetical protein
MKFKVPKSSLIESMSNQAKNAANMEIRNALTYQSYSSDNGIAATIATAVSRGIEQGVRAAMQEFFNQEYTNDDFERDLNLK